MNNLKEKIKKFIFNFKILINKVFCIINKKKLTKRIAIVSCDKWKNLVKEDILLKQELNKNMINAEIISWQDKDIDYSKYNALIIRSIWGYQDYIEDFIEWINDKKLSNIKVINPVDILLNNLNKHEQFKILDKNNIPHIETTFIEKNDIDDNKIKAIYNKNKGIVIKPIISGSGENTFIISNKIKKNSIELKEIKKKFRNVLNEYNNYIMVQPFIKEIKDGELSVVVINGKISHAAIRYINTFNDINQIKMINILELEKEALDIVDKCIQIKEYKESLYMRVDLVKVNNNYKIMELELVEPQLFFDYKQNKNKLKEFVNLISEL